MTLISYYFLLFLIQTKHRSMSKHSTYLQDCETHDRKHQIMSRLASGHGESSNTVNKHSRKETQFWYNQQNNMKEAEWKRKSENLTKKYQYDVNMEADIDDEEVGCIEVKMQRCGNEKDGELWLICRKLQLENYQLKQQNLELKYQLDIIAKNTPHSPKQIKQSFSHALTSIHQETQDLRQENYQNYHKKVNILEHLLTQIYQIIHQKQSLLNIQNRLLKFSSAKKFIENCLKEEDLSQEINSQFNILQQNNAILTEFQDFNNQILRSFCLRLASFLKEILNVHKNQLHTFRKQIQNNSRQVQQQIIHYITKYITSKSPSINSIFQKDKQAVKSKTKSKELKQNRKNNSNEKSFLTKQNIDTFEYEGSIKNKRNSLASVQNAFSKNKQNLDKFTKPYIPKPTRMKSELRSSETLKNKKQMPRKNSSISSSNQSSFLKNSSQNVLKINNSLNVSFGKHKK